MESATDSRKVRSQLVEAINLIAQGKRNLLCGEVHQAVGQLEEASKIFAQEYGELADECSDAYYSYGRALLELHRLETTSLGDVMKNEEEDEDEDEEDDDNENKDTNENEKDDTNDGNSSDSSETSEELVDEECTDNVDGTICSTKDQNKDEQENAKDDQTTKNKETEINAEHNKPNDVNVASTNEKEPEASTSKCQTEEQDKEDVSSLQLAWEVLELAKVIYLRQISPEAKIKLSDTYFKLGDVSLESEQFTDAIKDYNSCLNLQQEHLPADNRLIAETLYQLGLAHTLMNDYKPAYKFFEKTIELLEKRIERLTKVSKGELEPSPEDEGDGFYTPIELAGKEITELEELVKEIHYKIEEVKDEERNAGKVSVLMKESLTPVKHSMDAESKENSTLSSQAACTKQVETGPVNNITHLVRKKKITDEVKDEATEEKKKKYE